VPRKLLRKYLPAPEAVLAKRWAAPLRPWLGHPNLWHLNRRSVSGAVAIGLFCGLIPGPFQMLGALLMAMPLKRNIPVALAVTLYTNPLTLVPLYMLAYGYGRLLLGDSGPEPRIAPPAWEWSLAALWEWTLGLGKPLAAGLPALAVTLALVGYFATDMAWRAYVRHAWRTRRRARARA
jgi:uncharacterized protein (DUF2062 family)